MSNAPERITVSNEFSANYPPTVVASQEYVRVDLYTKAVAQATELESRLYREQAKVAKLREALGKYGVHVGDEPDRFPSRPSCSLAFDGDGPCTCGLDAALKGDEP